jgi:hypothetical protein
MELPLFRPLVATALACFLAACDAAPPPSTARQAPPPPPASEHRAPANVTVTQPQDFGRGGGSDARAVKQRQIEFLHRIRDSDPQGRTIDRAIFNEENELGLILDRSVEMDKIPALMRTILTGMAREFPGQDLTVLAYTPSQPPRKIGTAHLDARTRDMSYTPAR